MSGKLKDMTGEKYGKLTVLKFSHMRGKHSYWLCKCDCGNLATVRADGLKRGTTKSCGCLIKNNHPIEHGQAKTKLYHLFYGMKQRCYNPKHESYHRYGGRGITICDKWLNDYMSFYRWSMKNGYKPGLTIDRIDNDGNYEPDNCRWITQKEQTRNTSRNTKITIDGVTKLLIEWCELYGVNPATACYRIKRGWNYSSVFKITSKV